MFWGRLPRWKKAPICELVDVVACFALVAGLCRALRGVFRAPCCPPPFGLPRLALALEVILGEPPSRPGPAALRFRPSGLLPAWQGQITRLQLAWQAKSSSLQSKKPKKVARPRGAGHDCYATACLQHTSEPADAAIYAKALQIAVRHGNWRYRLVLGTEVPASRNLLEPFNHKSIA